jgi:hypothetical protein
LELLERPGLVSAVRVYDAALALARRLEMGTDTDAFTQATTALLQVSTLVTSSTIF